jgi:uncharacterized protein (DUF885 family)
MTHSQLPPTVNEVAEDFVDAYAALDPYTATRAGLTGWDRTSTDLSPEGFAARRALTERALTLLASTSADGEQETVARQAMHERLSLDVEMDEAGLNRNLNVISSPIQWAREAFDLMPTDTDDHWSNIVARLRDLPKALDQYRQTIRTDISAGRPPARRQVMAVAKQCDRVADIFFGELVKTGPEALRRELDDAAVGASAAFTDFGSFLNTEVAGHADEHDAVGRDAYNIASRYFLGATIDFDETYEWAVAELIRIEAEMAAVAALIAPDGSVQDAVRLLDIEPGRTVTGMTALKRWMQDLSDRTVDALNGVHFDIPEPIRQLHCHIAPTNDGGMYYTAPSEDFTRPGRIWWSGPDGVEGCSTWRDHDGLPRRGAWSPPTDCADDLPAGGFQPLATDAELGIGAR